jgi:thioredoxin-dependent peroxiredoxin
VGRKREATVLAIMDLRRGKVKERDVADSVERVGEAHELGEQLTVVGRRLEPGDVAPEFELESFDGATMCTVRLADSAGTLRLLNVINSIDTPVCHVETRRWEQERGALPPDARFYTISMDLPFALARWNAAEDVHHQALSAHKSEAFGRDYGVLLKEWRLLQRAVFVIGRDDRIVYAEYVADQMLQPDYAAALVAARG